LKEKQPPFILPADQILFQKNTPQKAKKNADRTIHQLSLLSGEFFLVECLF